DLVGILPVAGQLLKIEQTHQQGGWQDQRDGDDQPSHQAGTGGSQESQETVDGAGAVVGQPGVHSVQPAGFALYRAARPFGFASHYQMTPSCTSCPWDRPSTRLFIRLSNPRS